MPGVERRVPVLQLILEIPAVFAVPVCQVCLERGLCNVCDVYICDVHYS